MKWGDVQKAMVQNQWYHFGMGAPPILVYFSGDWDVHWGNGLLTHGPTRNLGNPVVHGVGQSAKRTERGKAGRGREASSRAGERVPASACLRARACEHVPASACLRGSTNQCPWPVLQPTFETNRRRPTRPVAKQPYVRHHGVEFQKGRMIKWSNAFKTSHSFLGFTSQPLTGVLWGRHCPQARLLRLERPCELIKQMSTSEMIRARQHETTRRE